MDIRQGDIFYANLAPVIGNEVGGIRPVVVVSSDISNKHFDFVTVVVVTSMVSDKMFPTHVLLSANEYGFIKDSVILTEHVRTISKGRLTELIGRLDKNKMIELADAWRVNLSFDIDTYDKKKAEKIEFIADNIIQIEENIEYEFKEIKGNNPVDSIKSQVGRYATSFLNQRGGRIYWGISDERRIVGVKLSYEQRDELRRVVFDVLNTIQPSLSASAFELNLHNVYEYGKLLNDLYVVELKVPIPVEPSTVYFLGGKELFVRVEGSTRILLGSAIQDYIMRKSKQ